MELKRLGPLAFLVGLVLAVLGGLLPVLGMESATATVSQVLLVLGLLVGLMNITVDEEVKFLLAGLSLVFLGVGLLRVLELIPFAGDILKAILNNLITFASPAIGVVAVKILIEIMRD